MPEYEKDKLLDFKGKGAVTSPFTFVIFMVKYYEEVVK